MMEQGMTKETADKILTAKRKEREAQGLVQKSEDLEKGGEGSRGGKVIGRTKTGKPIYDSHDHEGHKDFTAQEHKQAARVSEKLSDDADEKAGKLGSEEGEAHYDRADAHHTAALKQEMSKKKKPKPPKHEKFAQMSMEDHFKEKEKHYKMSEKHEKAGNKEHADMHRKLFEAHDQAHGAHTFKEMAQKNENQYGEEHGKEYHEISGSHEKDSFAALDEAHAMHSGEKKEEVKKSVQEHLANVEKLLK